MDVKNPVKNMIAIKTANKPKVKENTSLLLSDFKQKATTIGIIGRIHGDNMEITPVKKDIKGNISI